MFDKNKRNVCQFDSVVKKARSVGKTLLERLNFRDQEFVNRCGEQLNFFRNLESTQENPKNTSDQKWVGHGCYK